METVAHHGRETAYRAPDVAGVPVVFVHGSGADHRVWVRQYGRSDGPYAGVALDLSGHGDSADVDTPAGEETLTAYATDLAAVARTVDARVLVGNSLGGAVVLAAALEERVEVDGLVLCGTGAKLGVSDDLLATMAEDFDAFVDAAHARDMLFHDPAASTDAASREAMRAVGPAVTRRDFHICDRFDVRDRLDEIGTPGLAVTGEHDRLTPPRFHEYLAGELPDCECALVPEAAHLSFLERPDAWNERVDPFVRRVTDGAG